MVYGFLKQSGGHIEVQSGLGQGTTFQLYLPLASELPADARSRSEMPKSARGAETILLVEDEDGVRRLCKRVLEANGYRVLEACHGEEALKVVRRHAGKLDILVSDLVMPQMGGRRLAAQLRKRCLFCAFFSSRDTQRTPRCIPSSGRGRLFTEAVHSGGSGPQGAPAAQQSDRSYRSSLRSSVRPGSPPCPTRTRGRRGRFREQVALQESQPSSTSASRSSTFSTPSPTTIMPMSLQSAVIERMSFCLVDCLWTSRTSVMSSLTISGSSSAKLVSPA